MRAAVAIARDGDTLDLIAWREAGLGPAALPALFDANPGICEMLIFSAGTRINLPASITETTATPVLARPSLWS